MPVTGTFGALTYAKIGENDNPDFQYWAVMPSNISNVTFKDLYIDSANGILYNLAEDASANTVAIRISGFVNPVTSNVVRSNVSPQANAVVGPYNVNQFSYTGNALYQVGTILARFSYAFPYYTCPSIMYGTINQTTANANTLDYIRPVTTGSANLQHQIYGRDMINTANGVITLSNEVTLGQVSIAVINTSANAHIRFIESNTTTANNALASSLETDSTGNLIVYYDFNNNANNKRRLFVRKLNKTTVLNGFGVPYYPTIWGYGYQVSTNSNLFSTLARLDSNDNIYCTGYNSSNNYGLLLKIDNTGNITWQKELANTYLTAVALQSDSNIFVTGKNGNNLYVAKFDDTGNVIWQNQFTGSNAFTGNQRISVVNSNVYLGSTFGNKSLTIKVPDTGNISGNGTYNFVGSNLTITYSASNVSITNASLTSFAPAVNSMWASNYEALTRGVTNTAISTVQQIANLT